jgi:penicillin-binding protein 1B
VPQDGIERAWIAPASGKRTDSGCAGARELPFAVGYPPEEEEHCPLDQLRNFFGGSGD